MSNPRTCTRHLARVAKYAICAVLIAGTFIFVSAAAAAAHTCGSNWCSGTDGLSGTVEQKNIQGNNPQIYVGETYIYYIDMGGSGGTCETSFPDGSCFDETAAGDADARYRLGQGIGVQFYSFDGGAASTYESEWRSPYCFGWTQAYDTLYNIYDSSTFWYYYQTEALVMFMDIEQNNAFGWSNMTQSGNRSVFDGFTDQIAGRSSKDSRCTYQFIGQSYQYGAYSSPDQWLYSFGSSSNPNSQVDNTLIFTSQVCCSNTWPGGSFANADFFGSSDYNVGYQFDEGPQTVDGHHYNGDYDEFFEPIYLPVLYLHSGVHHLSRARAYRCGSHLVPLPPAQSPTPTRSW